MSQFTVHIKKRARIWNRISKTALLIVLIFLVACKRFIEIPPPSTELSQKIVFSSDETALSALASVYIKLSSSGSFADGGSSSITVMQGLYSDELTSYASNTSAQPLTEFYFNNVTPLNSFVSSTWSNSYKIIYECNRILEGVDASKAISIVIRKQLIGEALFIRAFCNFYLVNLFGDIPLVLNSDYRLNTGIPRTSSNKIYDSILNDLVKAQDLLDDSYPSPERVRVNKGVVTALLSRVYLYMEDFVNAELQSSELINKSTQYKLSNSLDNVYLKTSEEAIWQLLPNSGTQNYTNEGYLFILKSIPTTCVVSDDLYSAFEENDLRKSHWIDSISSTSGLTKWYYAHKFKENNINATGAEYSMVFRLAEQYLIRAEARANQSKLIGVDGAKSDVDLIRKRAGLSATKAVTKEEFLAVIEKERRSELFTEWGHRFFDLKRTGRLDIVLATKKVNWDNTDTLLPIPQSEILINSKLTQNPGH